ncbi:MAG TPA: peptidase domain-containing ABC transporter [Bacteroidales bacterium]|nr:peptidase domain-containing ABC transporter [Bacteroidales bacterium]
MKIRVKQRDITDCGAACLASIAAYYGMSMPVARIRQFAGTDKKGTNVLGLLEAASKLGFTAKGVRGEWDSLFKIPKPAIAHMIVKKVLTHYVVVLKTTSKYIEIMDPIDGLIHKVPHEEFREEWTGVLILIVPGEKFSRGNEKIPIAMRLWELIKPNRGILLQTLAGAIVFSVLGLSTSLFVGRLVDQIIPESNTGLLNLLGTAMIMIILVRLLLGFFQSLFILKTGQRIDATLILGYYQHLLRLPQSFFDNMRTGEIISRIGDAVKIRVFINEVSINLVLNIFILIVSFILMFSFFWKLALIMIMVIPVYTIIYLFSDRINRKIQRRVMEKSADLEAQLVESLNSAGTIKRFGLEEYENLKTEARFTGLLQAIYKSGMSSIMIGSSSSLVTQLITIILLWAGAGYVICSQVTAGELITFYSIAGYFTGPVTGIISFNRTLQDAKIAGDRLFEIFDLDADDDKDKIELKKEMVDDISFENVFFRYGTRVEVFKSLNLCFRKGEITALVGESGSGKSTIASLLQNLYPLQDGNIHVGKYDIRHLSGRSLRHIISVVPQKIDLFSGNVIDNIAVGELSPDMDKILSVCERLGMIRFIESLPNGFRTLLGENGAVLSGGQKQRIAIARALYLDPEVLILDEATSSLDSLAETFVHNTLKMLREEKKTVIVIAHRLSTISLADRIFVLEKGAIVQEGTFSGLAAVEGLFRKMWIGQQYEREELRTLN